jgi:hypothetical protein
VTENHGAADAYPVYDPFRPESDYIGGTFSGDHKHYGYDNDGNMVEANALEDVYLEACRFRRVAGRLLPATDWQVVAFNVLPGTFLSTNSSDYVDYVQTVVEDYIKDIGNDYPQTLPQPGTTTIANAPDSKSMSVDDTAEMISRVIYIEYMDDETVQALKTLVNANAEDALSFVPFYEVNVTGLAAWTPEDSAVAAVTNEAIPDTFNDPYSRGEVTAIGNGTETVVSIIRKSNTGLTDNSPPIDPYDRWASPGSLSVDANGVVTASDETLALSDADIEINVGLGGPEPSDFSKVLVQFFFGAGSDVKANKIGDIDASVSTLLTGGGQCTTPEGGDPTLGRECPFGFTTDVDGNLLAQGAIRIGCLGLNFDNQGADTGCYNYTTGQSTVNLHLCIRDSDAGTLLDNAFTAPSVDGPTVSDNGTLSEVTEITIGDVPWYQFLQQPTLNLLITDNENDANCRDMSVLP